MTFPLSGRRVLVTGGAGFVGSRLVAALLAKGAAVTCVDDLSSGAREALGRSVAAPGFRLVAGDCSDPAVAARALEGSAAVFHLAANPEVRIGATEPAVHVDRNVTVTFRLLEAMRRAGVRRLSFTSTSTVYGVATRLPTPEDYGPLAPISVYGASKLACEALIASYCGTFEFAADVFRFANVVGPGATHGVVVDFVAKLRKDPARLEVLGDGKQAKSYVHVDDTVEGMLAPLASGPVPGECRYWNIGTDDTVDVNGIADEVERAMKVKPQRRYVAAAPGGGGWKGDVPRMSLDCARLKALGWRPRLGSREAIRETVAWAVGRGA